ncbi:hypothetical protein D3C87_505000 [compost metagenome]
MTIIKKSSISLLMLLLVATAADAERSYNIIVRLNASPQTGGPIDGGDATGPAGGDGKSWLSFFQNKGSLSSLTNINQWRKSDKQGSVLLSNRKLANTSLPGGTLGTAEIYDIDMSNNHLSNLNFMNGVKESHNIVMSDNRNLNINGLKSLESVSTLDLKNTYTNDFSSLSNLRSADYINLGIELDTLSEPTITINSMAGLGNISTPQNGNKIKIVLPYEANLVSISPTISRLKYSTPLCRAIEAGRASVAIFLPTEVDENGKPGGFIEYDYFGTAVCDGDEWMTFFHKANGSYQEYMVATNPGMENKSMRITSREMGEAIPKTPYPQRWLGRLDLDGDYVENIDFLSMVTRLDEITIENSGINNINGLGNVSSANYITLRNMPGLKDISALSKITNATNMTIDGTGIVSLNGIQNRNQSLYNYTITLTNNPYLKDISALASLDSFWTSSQNYRWVTLYVDNNLMSNITAFPPLSSPFCQSALNGLTRVYRQSDSSLVPPGTYCH